MCEVVMLMMVWGGDGCHFRVAVLEIKKEYIKHDGGKAKDQLQMLKIQKSQDEREKGLSAHSSIINRLCK